MLPYNCDTLMLSFTIKFLGNITQPTTYNDPDFAVNLKTVYQEYEKSTGFLPLAKRYAQNLANGRFLWRNRLGAEDIMIRITNTQTQQDWWFNAYHHDLYEFDAQSNQSLLDISTLIANSFASGNFLLFKVVAFVKLGHEQHVFPSQEMLTDIPKGEKTKHLYKLKTDFGYCAAMHSEKIGNAIRSIDTWYQSDLTPKPAIAVESYGSVPNRGMAYRTDKTDFYTLLQPWMTGESTSLDEQHFIVANLIRGGVFGGND